MILPVIFSTTQIPALRISGMGLGWLINACIMFTDLRLDCKAGMLDFELSLVLYFTPLIDQALAMRGMDPSTAKGRLL